MRALAWLVLCLLAACGGGGDSTREHPAAVQTAEGFSRASTAYCLDWEGVWIPLEADEPCYQGGRRVKNLYLNSDDPSKWQLLTQNTPFAPVLTQLMDGSTGYALQITHAQGQNLSPFFYTSSGSEPGAQPPSVFASRVDVRFTSGDSAQKINMVGRTWGAAHGSESNNPSVKVNGQAWVTLAQTHQQFEVHTGWSDTQGTVAKTPKTYLLARKQFEDLSGAKTPISGEYCPSTDKPGVCWFDTAPNDYRTGLLTDTWYANGAFTSGGGILTDGIGSPFLAGALQVEPASTNVIAWNTSGDVGIAVADGSSDNHPQNAAGFAGGVTVLVDPRSGREVYGAKDLVFAVDTITSTKSDLSAFRVGHSVWVFVLGKGRTEAFTVLESSPRLLRLSGTLPVVALNTKASIHRIPADGDPIMVRRNNGAMHYTSVAHVQLPTLSASTAIDGYQHQSLVVTLADAFPSDGVNVGHVGNENQPIYFGAQLVYDPSVVSAGLGYLLRHRLVRQAPVTFDGIGYTGSAWVKGAGLLCVADACTPFNTTNYERVAANGYGALSVVGSALVAVPQLEALPYASSPIETRGGAATRAATVIDTGSN